MVKADDFENGSLSSGESFNPYANGKSITSSFGHTGTHSVDTYITQNYGGVGFVISGSVINSGEIYVSWWEYAQQNNAPYGILYAEWHLICRGTSNSQGSATTRFGWEPTDPNCFGGCTKGANTFYDEGTGVYPNWALYGGGGNIMTGQWVQYEAHLKANDPGQNNGDAELFQNGKLLMQVNQSSANVDNRCPTGGCGNFVGTMDFTNADLLIGDEWGALWVSPDGSPQDQNMAACHGDPPNIWNNYDPNTAYTAQQMCPPNGIIPYFHIYVDDVIVLKK
jgi:hypothetical protein